MSIQRNTRQFTDLNLLFNINPVTKDITKLSNEEAIKASVKNLVQTANYERPFHPEIGCQVYGLLFENFTPITVQVMRKTIFDVIEKFEPRVTVSDVRIRNDVDRNSIFVDIYFRIINTERPVQLTTSLTRVR